VELNIQVRKRNGTYEEFQQTKLINGLDAACRHTQISHEQIIGLASKITIELLQRHVREINTHEIGDMVMKYLQPLDPIAYIRFACVYKRFKDIEELVDAIEAIQSKDEQ
jgi:transcriptional repressor NrdR